MVRSASAASGDPQAVAWSGRQVAAADAAVLAVPGDGHRSVPPRSLPAAEGLDVAAWHVRPAPGSDIDGAWYDVIPLGAGRTAIAIGDVAGRGPAAAAVTGRLRAALHACARLDPPPSQIIEQLDAVITDLGVVMPVTCCYAVFDPADASISAASAGHEAPLVVHPDGAADRLKLSVGQPLGARGWPVTELAGVLAEHSTLLLHTDGLAEPLRALFTGGGGLGTAECGKGVVAALPPGASGALVLVRRVAAAEGAARTRMIELALSDGLEPTRRARAFCFGALSTWRVPERRCEDIVLVVSELVTNAVLHGESVRQLRLRHTASRVIVEVFDNGRNLPHPRLAALEAESGRGLQLVTRLADRWGARPLPSGKVVWCEFDLPNS